MKQWTVYFRDKNGSKASVVIEAEDRSGVFAELRKRGISAISVTEGASNKKPRKAASSGASSKGRGLIAAAIVVLVAGIAAWWMWPEREQVVEEDSKQEILPSSNDEGKKEVLKKNPVPKKKFKDLTNDEKLKYYRDKYGDNIPENLKSVVYFLENPPKQNFKPAPRPYSIFKRRSEREIAAMLLVEPGDWMLRAPTFDSRFDNDFSEALSEKIEFSEEDTEDQRQLKQAVIDTKNELAARIKNGEKASNIMNEAAKDLYELGRYRRELESQIIAVRRDESYSDQDVIDFVTAANEMLKKKGARPLKMPNMIIRHASLKHRAAKEKQKKEGELK